jgi:uncharacterized protein
MADQELVSKTAEFIKNKFKNEGTGHDWWHLYRVWQLSKHIAAQEKDTNLLVVELAALLHDIADHKFHGGDTEVGAIAAREWLQKIKADELISSHVENIVRHISFKSADIKNQLDTLEGRIVHDADKLDAIGAIGIARVFSFGGAHGRLIYDPMQPHLENYTYETAKLKNSSAIHHFYEKLLLLKDRMYTETGKEMAEHRHKFMEEYLKEFYAEWEGTL